MGDSIHEGGSEGNDEAQNDAASGRLDRGEPRGQGHDGCQRIVGQAYERRRRRSGDRQGGDDGGPGDAAPHQRGHEEACRRARYRREGVEPAECDYGQAGGGCKRGQSRGERSRNRRREPAAQAEFVDGAVDGYARDGDV